MSRLRLIDRLPPVRGSLTAEVPLASYSWFRVGGPAEVLFEPADRDDLLAFLSAKPATVPVTVIGVGSNLLIRDGGVPGVVVRLGRNLAGIVQEGCVLRVGAGAIDPAVAAFARDAGLAGMEFLSGVPGSIGGALRMNAGAYGGDMESITLAATLADTEGRLHRVKGSDLRFSYRHCVVAEDWIFVEAELAGRPDRSDLIAERMALIRINREESQPMRTRTGGSTFANPPGQQAWRLIDAAGCRGLVVGGAQVSEKHCNFLINLGTASAADIESLGEQVRTRVLASTGVALAWEIRRIGVGTAGERR